MSYICEQCLIRYTIRPTPVRLHLLRGPQNRSITEKVLQNRIQAEWRWKAWAQEIEAGKRKGMLQILEERGYINQIAGTRDQLDHLLTWKRVGAYVGIDPTAASMHVGHMIPFMALYWMYLYGFHAVTLLGGLTARIGDPTGRLAARERTKRATQLENVSSMHVQLKRIWQNVETCGRRFGYEKERSWHRELCNNSMWLSKVRISEVLMLMGSGLRLGAMLGRDTVKNRLEKGDGMSFNEFCYPVLQAWDWWHMYHTKGIQLQIGGADQYGNIISGIDAVKHVIKNHPDPTFRLNNAMKNVVKTDHYRLQNPDAEELDPSMEPMGFTVPLLTTASGEKFGKSAGNAIWLNKEMTSVFDLYGYLVGTPDADVERLLKLLTFLPLSDIAAIMAEHYQDPTKRKAQHALATELVSIVHSEQEAKTAGEQHQRLVAQRDKLQISDLLHTSAETQELPGSGARTTITAQNAPNMRTVLPRSLVSNQTWPRVLHAAGIVDSASAGMRLIAAHGAYVGSKPGGRYNRKGGLGGPLDGSELTWTPIKAPDKGVDDYVVEGDEQGDLLVLRHGKWKIRLIRVVEDEEFERLKAQNGWDDPPGWAALQESKLSFRKIH